MDICKEFEVFKTTYKYGFFNTYVPFLQLTLLRFYKYQVCDIDIVDTYKLDYCENSRGVFAVFVIT